MQLEAYLNQLAATRPNRQDSVFLTYGTNHTQFILLVNNEITITINRVISFSDEHLDFYLGALSDLYGGPPAEMSHTRIECHPAELPQTLRHWASVHRGSAYRALTYLAGHVEKSLQSGNPADIAA